MGGLSSVLFSALCSGGTSQINEKDFELEVKVNSHHIAQLLIHLMFGKTEMRFNRSLHRTIPLRISWSGA
jgi:hypothetical protein